MFSYRPKFQIRLAVSVHLNTKGGMVGKGSFIFIMWISYLAYWIVFQMNTQDLFKQGKKLFIFLEPKKNSGLFYSYCKECYITLNFGNLLFWCVFDSNIYYKFIMRKKIYYWYKKKNLSNKNVHINSNILREKNIKRKTFKISPFWTDLTRLIIFEICNMFSNVYKHYLCKAI